MQEKVQSLLSYQIKQAEKQAKGSVREARLKETLSFILRVDKHKGLMKRSVMLQCIVVCSKIRCDHWCLIVVSTMRKKNLPTST